MRSRTPTEYSSNPINTDRLVGNSKLLGQLRDDIRRRHYSIRTEQAYLDWARRYILFHGKRHQELLKLGEETGQCRRQ